MSYWCLLSLTKALFCDYDSVVNHDIILNHAGSVSQGDGRVAYPDAGLRILARLIARDLLSKHQDKTKKKKDGELSDPQMLERCQ